MLLAQIVAFSLFLYIVYTMMQPLLYLWEKLWQFLKFGYFATDYITGGGSKPDPTIMKTAKTRYTEMFG